MWWSAAKATGYISDRVAQPRTKGALSGFRLNPPVLERFDAFSARNMHTEKDCLRLRRRRFTILDVTDLPKEALDSIDKLLN